MPLSVFRLAGMANLTCWAPQTSGGPGHTAFEAISSLVGSLLVTLTIRPPAGAGAGNRTGCPVVESVTTYTPLGPTGRHVGVVGGPLQLIIVNNWMVIEVCRFWPTDTLCTAIGCIRAETIGPTFTVVVAGAMPGALAVIIAVPWDTPVTGE